ncbi:MaoC family dehydratase [Salipiger bermudensis]|uniref:MaoC family dehydratase n=1 Tax=Salipiger bermudensis TaxID=344736 RepID=UPI001CD69AE3|nr:MaoC family dehydratase [Salipiger bermudensis]MCA0964617.1 MaoC family dehydratase [Salipiger bermudensis]
MITVEQPADMAAHAGQRIGHSDWMRIDQEAISAFARLTGDDHWIHVDPERASRDMPGGRTIAHGLHMVSLMPRLQREIYAIRKRGRGLNYGYDKIRFVAPVQVDSRIRLALTVVEAAPHARGTRLVCDATIEVEGMDRPAVVARHILLLENG